MEAKEWVGLYFRNLGLKHAYICQQLLVSNGARRSGAVSATRMQEAYGRLSKKLASLFAPKHSSRKVATFVVLVYVTF